MAEDAENQLDREQTNKEELVHDNEARSILKMIWHRKAVWFKLTVTVMEMTINGNKSNSLTVTVTEKFH